MPEDESVGAENRASFFQKPVGARIGLDIDLSAYTQEATVPVLPEPSARSEAMKNKDDTAPTQNGGLIEFDLDAFYAEVSKIKVKSKN